MISLFKLPGSKSHPLRSRDLGGMDIVIDFRRARDNPDSRELWSDDRCRGIREILTKQRLRLPISLLRCIYHVSLLELGWMVTLDWLLGEHVSLLLLGVFSRYRGNYEPECIFPHQK